MRYRIFVITRTEQVQVTKHVETSSPRVFEHSFEAIYRDVPQGDLVIGIDAGDIVRCEVAG